MTHMFALLKSKIALAIIGCIAVGSLTATAAVATSQHVGPFAVNTTQHGVQGGGDDNTKTPGANGHETHLQGQIKSVTFASGSTNAGTLVLLPKGKQQTVTVQFTAQTKVEVSVNHSGDDSSKSGDDSKGTPTAKNGDDNKGTPTAKNGDDGKGTPTAKNDSKGASALVAGLNVEIEGTTQADGSVLAKVIEANDNENASEGTPEPGDAHGTPEPGDNHGTPEPGDTHGKPTPQPSH
jgi:hypothetical protein